MNRTAVLALLLLAQPASACDLEPDAMIARIHAEPRDALIAEWWDLGPCAETIFDGVSSGRPEWLRFAVAVRPLTDGWSGESLVTALGEAMLRAPSRVLQLVEGDGAFGASICYPNLVDDSEEAIEPERRRMRRALAMFKSFSQTRLASPALLCAAELRQRLSAMDSALAGSRP